MNTKDFLNKHKKTIVVVAGVTVTVVMGAALYHYRQPILAFCQKGIRVKTPMRPITKTTIIAEKISIQPKQITQLPLDVKSPYSVKGHFRQLPDGWHASPEKIKEMLAMGVQIKDGVTYVDSFIKNVA